jgi:16S rRNA (guanine527-N7)-methyltransferase
VLDDARQRGFLGPGDVQQHVRHSQALAGLLGDAPERFLDLGSGAGIPGLVLAGTWTATRAVLLDAAERRCRFLNIAIDRLGLSDRVEVRCGRAEDLARDPMLRGAFPLVVARGFAAPPIVAECGVGFLCPGGRLVVTEPPADAGSTDLRWPPTGTRRLGLVRTEELRRGDTGAVVLELAEAVADRWPRRSGIPGKRPLW